MLVEFTRDDICDIVLLALKFAENKLRNEYQPRVWGRESAGWHSQFIEGLLGEVAVSRVLGGVIDDQVYDYHDTGTDITFPNGKTAQIKTRWKRGADFALNSVNLDEFKTDYGIICYPFLRETPDGFIPSVDVAAYISRRDFAVRHKKTTYGYGYRLAVPLKSMDSIEDLVEELAGGDEA